MTATVASEQAVPIGRGQSELRLRRLLQLALIGFPVVVLGVQAWAHRWIADDGFINFHIVDQIAAGNGPVFNAGQRVEAFTSPLSVSYTHLTLPTILRV